MAEIESACDDEGFGSTFRVKAIIVSKYQKVFMSEYTCVCRI